MLGLDLLPCLVPDGIQLGLSQEVLRKINQIWSSDCFLGVGAQVFTLNQNASINMSEE